MTPVIGRSLFAACEIGDLALHSLSAESFRTKLGVHDRESRIRKTPQYPGWTISMWTKSLSYSHHEIHEIHERDAGSNTLPVGFLCVLSGFAGKLSSNFVHLLSPRLLQKRGYFEQRIVSLASVTSRRRGAYERSICSGGGVHGLDDGLAGCGSGWADSKFLTWKR